MTDNKVFPILSIAGSDCSGGAGIQADIKTISAHGCYAMAAITSLTAQNTLGVSLVEGVSPLMVSEQIRMVYADIPP
ncbi:MAG: bifunctional hydroxymethylpyrimidine kinase/phosphomethylpyrimidine kinase, partial [Muribaculaceae bacterium]|nr:bifunctional hydroxymethylpyrimidine kinase/phosphomethylpyrimidine kinase [Muribaculaceae bacterium]